MAYIGNTPAENYASFLTETFTVSATTNYTLSHAVTNENEIRLVINGVVQQPGSGKAYTASGTTLTLSSATASGDSMYAVYLGRALQTVNPPNASVGSDQTAPTIITGQTAETSIATDDTILIHDTSASALRKMTRANFVSGVGGTTAPYVSVYRNGDQSISDATHTKIQFNVENVDSGGAFDSSTNYRYTPQTSGYYFVSVNLGTGVTADNAVDKILLTIYKNGSGITGALAIRDWDTVGINYNDQVNTSVIVQMNGSSDYIEAFAYIDVTSGTPRVESQQASMHIFKMTE